MESEEIKKLVAKEIKSAMAALTFRKLNELPGILPGQPSVSGGVQKIDCGNVATIEGCIDPAASGDVVTLAYSILNSVTTPDHAVDLTPIRFENPFGIVTDVTLFEDSLMEIFWDVGDNWIKLIPANAGKVATPGFMWGTNSNIYSGANTSVTPATEYFLSNGDLTAIPPVIFPLNGQSFLGAAITCDTTGSEGCTYVLLLQSHADGTPSDNDYIAGVIISFEGLEVLPYN